MTGAPTRQPWFFRVQGAYEPGEKEAVAEAVSAKSMNCGADSTYIPLAFTSIDNIRGGRRRRPICGVDNSVLDYNTDSNDPGYNIGSSVLGSNKPKPSLELSR